MGTIRRSGTRNVGGRRPSPKRPGQAPKFVAKQKRALLALAGIGASGFSDVSQEHDKYLHEKP
jgi:hypothetical protein